MYFAIEGIDGSGKSTLIKELKRMFSEAIFIREPGTTKFAEELRKVIFDNFKDMDPIAVQLAMLAASADLKSTLDQDSFIIADRCFLSGSYCPALSDKEKIKIWLLRTLPFRKLPDLIIYLDITADESIKRISNRKQLEGYDTIVKEEIENRIKSYNAWIDVAKELNINIIRVNANKSIKEVKNEVYDIIKSKLEGDYLQCEMQT